MARNTKRGYLMQALRDLPKQINTLEYTYNNAMEKLRAYKVRNRYYYDHYKRTQDIRRQLELNKKIANLYGVRYGLQAKALEASS